LAIHFAIIFEEADPTEAGHVISAKGAAFNLEHGTMPQAQSDMAPLALTQRKVEGVGFTALSE
jgi:hypothetical protein